GFRFNHLSTRVLDTFGQISHFLLGKNGVEERKSIGTLSAFEQNALEGMLDTLKKDIALGEEFVNK
ncbi:hypothetical protein ACUN9W_12530, partial [Escherichia coli]